MRAQTLKTNAEFAQLAVVLLFAFGISTLIFPYKIQAVALRKCQKFWGLPNPFLSFVETTSYIWMLRIMGVTAIAVGVFVQILILRR